MDPKAIGALALLLVIAGFICSAGAKKKVATRERYNDMFQASNFSRNGMMSRPNFKANLSPRFDATQARAGAITGTPPPFAMQGAPTTPVESLIEGYNSAPGFATMGGAYDARLPAGGLTTNQVNDIMAQKFGRQGSSEYMEPSSLLPVPDMRKALAKDPSNPSNFMYDRYLFAPLKRKYPNVFVDHIRGDLQIAPIRTGWFDVANPVKTDLAQGYFSDFLDIQQSASLQDIVFQRAPTPEQNLNPWGNLADRTINSLL